MELMHSAGFNAGGRFTYTAFPTQMLHTRGHGCHSGRELEGNTHSMKEYAAMKLHHEITGRPRQEDALLEGAVPQEATKLQSLSHAPVNVFLGCHVCCQKKVHCVGCTRWNVLVRYGPSRMGLAFLISWSLVSHPAVGLCFTSIIISDGPELREFQNEKP
eukprot:TRINITY_DN436_c0_g1_i3.p1 TRINITY_DN436_c0_g1~~TRINITY_DN436_c0_g1_i3.p1  ORF type:complete len:172 (+),score=8.87 TRINITY_DN436_c0_g1_i3:38-517(+)